MSTQQTTDPIWRRPENVAHSQLLLDSYERLLGAPLIDRCGDPLRDAEALFYAPRIVVSHGTQSDPILNYGNAAALDLWQLDWDAFTRTPSRKTAEPLHRDERAAMLAEAAEKGFIANYRGVRISSTGERFLVEDAVVWRLQDERQRPCGQAATFTQPQSLSDAVERP